MENSAGLEQYEEMVGGDSSSDDYGDEMADAEPEPGDYVALHVQLPPPDWTLRCKHWLPAEAPAATHAVVPNGFEKVIFYR